MARRKKQEAGLFPSERLARALVPPEEQPYPVPENWRWVRLGDAAQWGSGGTPSRKQPEYYSGNIPWVKTGELTDGYIFQTEEHITQEAVLNSNAKLFPINTVIVAMYGATIGKVGILGIEATTNQACACAVCSNEISYKYLFYYLHSQKNYFIRRSKGGAQPNISQEIIKQHSIPVPPLAEQYRIVSRIESLFAKLDDAREKAQEVVDGFENRKAAILHKAFTGELTRKWRDEHQDIYTTRSITLFNDVSISVKEQPYSVPENWTWKKLYAIVNILNGYAFKSKNYVETGIRIIRIANVQNGYIEDEKPVYYPVESIREIKKFILYENDLLISLTGNVGRIALLTSDLLPAALNQRVGCLRIKDEDELDKKYLFYFLLQKEFQEKCIKNSKGSAQLNMSTEWLKEQPIPIAPLEEQHYLVARIDSMMKKLEYAYSTAEQVIETIDAMRKAILARAFHGELGTNNKTDESAEELLKSII